MIRFTQVAVEAVAIHEAFFALRVLKVACRMFLITIEVACAVATLRAVWLAYRVFPATIIAVEAAHTGLGQGIANRLLLVAVSVITAFSDTPVLAGIARLTSCTVFGGAALDALPEDTRALASGAVRVADARYAPEIVIAAERALLASKAAAATEIGVRAVVVAT